jgi:hypothetical protein
MLGSADEDLTTDELENGLGSALYKLSKGRRVQEIYKKYANKEKPCVGMKYGAAINIIENLDKHNSEKIGLAIYTILNMTTIMAVTKNSLLDVVRYLFNKCYEVGEEGAE